MRLIDADEMLDNESIAYIKAQSSKTISAMTRDVNKAVHAKIQMLIADAQTVEAKPEWIPVTELDLDHNQEALIKLDDGFICSAKFLISGSGNNCGFYHKHVGFLQCPQVVAWMPYSADMRGEKHD